MSDLTTAARPYARAVFEMAQETNGLAKWSNSLAFMGAVASDEEVKKLLSSPKFAKQAGAEAFIKLCDNKLDDKEKNLVRMLAENDRLSLLPAMSEIYDELKAEAEGAVDAQVKTAKKLTRAEEEAISKALKKRLGREVNLKVSVDDSLLGGAIIQAGDLVIDGSIKGRLEKMAAVVAH